MSEWLEDFKQYLPKYLSPAATENLWSELRQFPKNINQRLYTGMLRRELTIFQGDGLADMPVTNLPDTRVQNARVMALSNTCDIAPENPRWVPARILYCPIISLNKYEKLVAGSGKELPASHIKDIRDQRITSMFFLPGNEAIGEDAIALLDRINNCDAQTVAVEEIPKRRLFTLSDYGFYLFLFKLSMHLTRIREEVWRSPD